MLKACGARPLELMQDLKNIHPGTQYQPLAPDVFLAHGIKCRTDLGPDKQVNSFFTLIALIP